MKSEKLTEQVGVDDAIELPVTNTSLIISPAAKESPELLNSSVALPVSCTIAPEAVDIFAPAIDI